MFVNSPKLFADHYVLHRLQLPRHPPGALLCLTISPSDFSSGLYSFAFVFTYQDNHLATGPINTIPKNSANNTDNLSFNINNIF